MILRDIEKVKVPAEILNQSSPLESSQKQIIMDHVPLGYDLLEKSKNEFLIKEMRPAILEHHMNWDFGNGSQSFYGSVIRSLNVMQAEPGKLYNPESVQMLLLSFKGLTSCSSLPLIPPRE